jgi:hypothetical protein
MSLHPEYTEITIMLAVEDCKPKVINSNFYYQSGIVPQNWNLANPPVDRSDVSQLQFTNNNGITLDRSIEFKYCDNVNY